MFFEIFRNGAKVPLCRCGRLFKTLANHLGADSIAAVTEAVKPENQRLTGEFHSPLLVNVAYVRHGIGVLDQKAAVDASFG